MLVVLLVVVDAALRRLTERARRSALSFLDMKTMLRALLLLAAGAATAAAWHVGFDGACKVAPDESGEASVDACAKACAAAAGCVGATFEENGTKTLNALPTATDVEFVDLAPLSAVVIVVFLVLFPAKYITTLQRATTVKVATWHNGRIEVGHEKWQAKLPGPVRLAVPPLPPGAVVRFK